MTLETICMMVVTKNWASLVEFRRKQTVYSSSVIWIKADSYNVATVTKSHIQKCDVRLGIDYFSVHVFPPLLFIRSCHQVRHASWRRLFRPGFFQFCDRDSLLFFVAPGYSWEMSPWVKHKREKVFSSQEHFIKGWANNFGGDFGGL